MALLVLPTIGAAERNWSAFSYICGRNRNSLLNDWVNKLVYIYWNLQIRERIGDKRNTWFDNKEDKDKEKDKNLIEALFKPDIYRFGNDKDDNQEDFKDYDNNILYKLTLTRRIHIPTLGLKGINMLYINLGRLVSRKSYTIP